MGRMTDDQIWEIKRRIKESNIKNYQIAEALGICESAVSKRMRSLTEEQALEIMSALERLSDTKDKVRVVVQHKDVTISWQQYDALLESANEVVKAIKQAMGMNDSADRLVEANLRMRAWINNLVAMNPYAKMEEDNAVETVSPQDEPIDRKHLSWEDAQKNGEELKAYLQKNNVTTKELADETGKSVGSICSYLRNCTDKSLKDLKVFVDIVAERKCEPQILTLSKEKFFDKTEEQEQGFMDESVINKWNAVSPYKIRDLKGKRKVSFKARIKKWGQKSFNEVLYHISRSDFLQGKSGRNGEHKNFRADFDWVMKSQNYTKVLEGKYDNCM